MLACELRRSLFRAAEQAYFCPSKEQLLHRILQTNKAAGNNHRHRHTDTQTDNSVNDGEKHCMERGTGVGAGPGTAHSPSCRSRQRCEVVRRRTHRSWKSSGSRWPASKIGHGVKNLVGSHGFARLGTAWHGFARLGTASHVRTERWVGRTFFAMRYVMAALLPRCTAMCSGAKPPQVSAVLVLTLARFSTRRFTIYKARRGKVRPGKKTQVKPRHHTGR